MVVLLHQLFLNIPKHTNGELYTHFFSINRPCNTNNSSNDQLTLDLFGGEFQLKRDNRKLSIRLCPEWNGSPKRLNSAPWPLTLTFTIILRPQMIKLQSVATIPVHQRPWLCIVSYCQWHSLLFLGLTCGQSLAIIITPTGMWHSISTWSKTCWICVWIELGQLWRWISWKQFELKHGSDSKYKWELIFV